MYYTAILRCPNNVLDFYEAIKYVSANAADLGVDPARIAMAGESGGADGAVVLLLVVEVLVLLPRLLRKEVLLAPGVTTPPQIVLEEEVSSAVGEDHVTDVTVVLLVGVAGANHHAVLLGDL